MNDTTLAFGEVLWDLLPTGPVLGGAPLNFACRMQGLGNNARMVSRLGCDDRGEEARRQMSALGVDQSLVQSDPDRPTGFVNITFDDTMTATIDIAADVAYDRIEGDPALLAAAETAACICFGTVAQRAPASRQTLQSVLDRAPQALKVFDINLRTNCFVQETIAASLERTDILKLSEPEAEYLAQAFDLQSQALPELCAAIMGRWSIACCIVTLEERGAFASSSEGEQVYVPGLSVGFVDPLGAGDAFTAGFMHKRLRGEPLAACMRFGNIMGAASTMHAGATHPISAADIEALELAAGPRRHDTRFIGYSIDEG